MKTYILDSINRIKRLGENLDAKTILCNKSWQIFNDTGEKELYIFQENGDILLSTNGIVSQGKWQYISANKSILISVKENSYMLHPSFSINNIMAMNLDGTERYMLMIEEKSLLALQLKSLEDLNQYLLSIENEEERKEKDKEYKKKEEELQKAAMKAWAANKKHILDSNKEYKRIKTLSMIYALSTFILPFVLITFLFLFNTENSFIIAIIVVFAFFVLLFSFLLYDNKCNEIIREQQVLFINNYMKERVNCDMNDEN